MSVGDNITRTQAVKLPASPLFPPLSSTSWRCRQLYSPRWQMKTSLWPSTARLSSFQSAPLNSAAHSVICGLVCQVIWKWQTVEMWWHAGSETTSVLRLYVSFFFLYRYSWSAFLRARVFFSSRKVSDVIASFHSCPGRFDFIQFMGVRNRETVLGSQPIHPVSLRFINFLCFPQVYKVTFRWFLTHCCALVTHIKEKCAQRLGKPFTLWEEWNLLIHKTRFKKNIYYF